MSYKIITFDKISKKQNYKQYFIDIDEQTYSFTLRWSPYSNCAFLSISDYNDNPIISGRALTNGLTIRNNLLPYVFRFLQLNGETYEPTLSTLSSEFGLIFNDKEE